MKDFILHVKSDLVANAKYRCIPLNNMNPKSPSWGVAASNLMIKVANFDKNSLGDRVIAVAHTQLGVKESPAGSNWGPQVSQYLLSCGITKSVPVESRAWCAALMKWCLDHALYTGHFPPNPASCPSWETWAKNNGLWIAASSTHRGDLLEYEFDGDPTPEHIGVCIGVDEHGNRKAIEGNTSPDDSGSQSNGGMVCSKTRSLSVIRGGIRLRDN